MKLFNFQYLIPLFIGLVCSFNALSQEAMTKEIEDLEHDYYAFILPSENFWDSTYISKKAGFGLNLGAGFNTSPFLDLGVGYASEQQFGAATIYNAVYGGCEMIFQNNDVIYGPKIATWTIGLFGFVSTGYNLIYYTDFKDGSWQFRPELGIGYKGLKLNYGYNIPISNRTFGNLSRHNISLVWFLRLSTHKSESYTYREIFDGEVELIKERYNP